LKLIIDLDGTICSEEMQFSRGLATPNSGAAESLRFLKSQGHIIIIYSARTWAEYEITIDWLLKFEIPFDQLILGKPQGDYWIDDRAIKFSSWKEVMEELP
jgi:uncharacterized HAD superfamily protein